MLQTMCNTIIPFDQIEQAYRLAKLDGVDLSDLLFKSYITESFNKKEIEQVRPYI